MTHPSETVTYEIRRSTDGVFWRMADEDSWKRLLDQTRFIHHGTEFHAVRITKREERLEG